MGSMQPIEAWPLYTCPAFLENDEVTNTYRTHYDGVDRNAAFNEEQYLICPPRVLGFFMVKKTWAQLLVGNIQYLEKSSGMHSRNLS